MQLTRLTDYGLRVLLYVARQHDRLCTMREIAIYHRVSLEHLRKVVHKLAILGYLKTSQGRNGGIVLGRDPAKIRIGDVVVALEQDLTIVDCQALNCVLQPGCSLKSALDRGKHAFISTLNEVTLADLLDDQVIPRQLPSIKVANRR
jgi:Rrf2 family transcriptional regulator, nitric oxide-sensitive transcriptional repressor